MAILILNRYPKLLVKFRDWLADIGEELYMYTTDRYASDFPDYEFVHGFENYVQNGLLEVEAMRLHAERPFRAIIALDESDILRAARLRYRLGLPGQTVPSALAFRDKVVMKEVASAAGIPNPPFMRLHAPFDLLDFVAEYGFPVVVKPVDGMGSMNTTVVQSRAELDGVLATTPLSGMMVEGFVPGTQSSIDGLVVGGRLVFCSVSTYHTDCLGYKNSTGLFISLVSPSQPKFQRLRHFAEQVIAALPTPDLTTIHCEVFTTPDDQIMLGEIASRTAGARIAECIRQTYGIDLDEAWVRLSAGLPAAIPDIKEPSHLAAVYLIPKRPGTLVSMVQQFPYDWVTEYQPRTKPGTTFLGGHSSVDTIGSVVFVGADESELLDRHKILLDYIQDRVVWADAESQSGK